jgi:hypothetical protein
MIDDLKIRRKFHVANGRTGHREVRDWVRAAPVHAGRVPRVSKLMALAIRFEQLIRDGVVRDQADIARLAGVSRARVTQIMDLLQLAPDIQEALLCLQGSDRGNDTITERELRPLATLTDWNAQLHAWKVIESSQG